MSHSSRNHVPRCKKCGDHFWFEPCSKKRSEMKVIWTPETGNASRPPVQLGEEDKDFTHYTHQQTSGDFFYCCSCATDFFSEERYPYKCMHCGSRDWDDPNQWKGGRAA